MSLPDGRTVKPSELVGPTRPGRRIVLTGDSRPSESTIAAATGADVLDSRSDVRERRSPARAGNRPLDGARSRRSRGQSRRKKLVLTHVSARYSRDTSELEREAREIFPATIVARDGLEVDVPFEPRRAPSTS